MKSNGKGIGICMKRARFLIGFGLVALSASAVLASTLMHMNLQKLCSGAESIFLGKVVSISEELIEAGGGRIPAVIYKLEVTETFKGSFATEKGIQIAEVRMLGTLKQVESGRPVIPGAPVLRQGTEYLLMVGPAGPIGLTSTIGLGQGCFGVSETKQGKVAINGYGNAGLFASMNSGGLASGQVLPYAALANMIRNIVGGGN